VAGVSAPAVIHRAAEAVLSAAGADASHGTRLLARLQAAGLEHVGGETRWRASSPWSRTDRAATRRRSWSPPGAAPTRVTAPCIAGT